MSTVTFEERVFLPTQRSLTTTKTVTLEFGQPKKQQQLQLNGNNNKKCVLNDDIDEEYEETIKALNGLQSNAETVRKSIMNCSKQSPLMETYKYLERSGLTINDLDKLSIIHVSGTKGKGSTCALTESILRNHNVKTGFFSSPHLVSVTERIRINGLPIEKSKFIKAFWRVYNRLKSSADTPDDMPAYFKFLTILGFHIFLEEEVDVVILEVGIGGELDCTNIVRNTQIVGITSLGLEHTQILGNSLPEIAWQKAGIIKANCNVYTSVTQPECLEVIKERALEKKASLFIVPEYTKYMKDQKSATILSQLNNVTQLNGSLAIQLANDWLQHHKKFLPCVGSSSITDEPNDLQLPPEILEGLSRCNWPGRCQRVELNNFNIHLDGAHTVESMAICSNWFHNLNKNSSNPKVLIFNATGDRDSRKLLEVLRHQIQFDIACFVPNIVAGRTNKKDNQSIYSITEQIKRAKLHAGNWNLLCTEAGEQDNSHIFGSILDSLNYIRRRYGDDIQLDLLITGSLHLIGNSVLALNEFKKLLEQI